MLRPILFFLLFLILYSVLRFFIKGMFFPGKKGTGEMEPEELVQDPYCQTYIPIKSAIKKKIHGRMLFFCNPKCKENYIKNFKKSIDKSK